MSYFNNVNTMYQICTIIYGLISSSTITPRISVPVSISIPYMSSSSKRDDNELKDLDFFQMEKLLTWMKFFFDGDSPMAVEEQDKRDNDNNKEQYRAYKRELYNIYVGIKSDYIQYQHWKKYNNSIWLFSSYRSKNTKDLSKKIISDIQLFNEGLKMFSIITKNNI